MALLPASTTANACGGPDWICNTCDTYFAPDVIGDPDAMPFFVGHPGPRDPHAVPRAASLDAPNIDEWFQYFHQTISKNELRQIVYKSNAAGIDKRIFALKAKTNKSDSDRRLIKALYYIGFAEKVEPYAMRAAGENSWETAEPVDPKTEPKKADIDALVAGGKRLASAADSALLLQRYQFQIVRLLFYTKDYAQAVSYFEQLKAEDGPESSIKYRLFDAAAGAYLRLEKVPQANYLYSRMSAYAPLKKIAYLSFNPQSEADWQETLDLATSPEQKEQIWLLLGLRNDPSRALAAIFALDPKAPGLSILLVNSVNQFEQENSAPTSQNRHPDEAVINRIKQIADTSQARKPEVWFLALGHLYAFTGQLAQAKEYLDKADQSANQDPAFRSQLALSRIVARVKSMPKDGQSNVYALPSAAAQNVLAADMNALVARGGEARIDENGKKPAGLEMNRAQHFYVWTKNFLSGVFKSHGDEMRALLLKPEPQSSYYGDNRKVEAMQSLIKGPQQSSFDVYLASVNRVTLAQYDEIRGINLMYQGQFSQAVPLLGNDKSEPLPADPFLSHIKDCHDCDFAAPKARTFTRVEFAQAMAELKEQAAAGTEASAQAAYDLATGYFNMSAYGNSRALFQNSLDTFWEADTKAAEQSYLKALTLSPDREFKAKALFMAAKAERDEHYNQTPARRWSDRPHNPYFAGEHFKALASEYADTKYYQEVLHECGFFKTYVGANGKSGRP